MHRGGTGICIMSEGEGSHIQGPLGQRHLYWGLWGLS